MALPTARRASSAVARTGSGGLPVHRPLRPAPVEQGQAALHPWAIGIHADDDLPWLVDIGQLHAQFETSDPFGDGNGRVGRLLITFLLTEWGALRHPLLWLALPLWAPAPPCRRVHQPSAIHPR